MSTPADIVDPMVLDQQRVTASDFVRHFGIWQDRAAQSPVYILHRGRPRHVLTSVDVMNALCEPHVDAAGGAGASMAMAMLDLTREIILFADAELLVTALSLPARLFFGGDMRIGTRLDHCVSATTGPMLLDAIRRVLQTGTADTIELAAARYPAQRLDAMIAPHGSGIILQLRDISIAEELANALEHRRSSDAAMAAATGVATATVNLRGHVEEAPQSLRGMTGLCADNLIGARFTALVDAGSRPPLADALEAVVAKGVICAVQAELLVSQRASVGVNIGLAPRRRGSAIIGVSAAFGRIDDRAPSSR